MRFRNQEGLSAKVVTFAAPKSGSAAFAAAYNAVMDHTRYEFAEDVVPHLPPSAAFLSGPAIKSLFGGRLGNLEAFDYERVGSLLYITRSLEIVQEPEDDAHLAERRSRLVRLALLNPHQIGDDHSIGCRAPDPGYMTALCPTGVCPPPDATSV